MKQKWAGDGNSGVGSARPGSHTYGGKIHRFSLPSGNLTTSFHLERASSLLQDRLAPGGPGSGQNVSVAACLQGKPETHARAISKEAAACGARVLITPRGAELCAHGRALRCSARVSVQREHQCEESRAKPRVSPRTGQSTHIRPRLRLHTSASLPADLRAEGCHSLPLVSSEVFLVACKTQSGWR